MNFRQGVTLGLAVMFLGSIAAPAETVILGPNSKTEDLRNTYPAGSIWFIYGGKKTPNEVDFGFQGGATDFRVQRHRMNGPCELVMQEDGNLCIYVTKNHGFVWGSGSKGTGCKLVLEDDGVLAIVDSNHKTVWTAPDSHNSD